LEDRYLICVFRTLVHFRVYGVLLR
jgi:hypothetical protein